MANKPNTDESTVAALNLQETIASLTAGDHYYMIPASGGDGVFDVEWCFQAPTVKEARRKAREAGVSRFWLMALSGGCVQLTC